MTIPKKITILYFTDLLCIWAYVSQIRIDQLKVKFGSDIVLKHHFVSVFGAVESKVEQNWGNKGGVLAYSKHVKEIAKKFSHIEIHPDIWAINTPTTSNNCHVFLKAIQLLEARNELPIINLLNNAGKSILEVVAWELRLAFFRDLVDISNYKSQLEIAERLKLPCQKIQQIIESGSAFAALESDIQLKNKHGITGSPSLVLNEGRQIIYGNVGYRVIEANVQELLNQPDNQASWC